MSALFFPPTDDGALFSQHSSEYPGPLFSKHDLSNVSDQDDEDDELIDWCDIERPPSRGPNHIRTSKRPWDWDDNDSSGESDLGIKRVKTRSLSPISPDASFSSESSVDVPDFASHGRPFILPYPHTDFNFKPLTDKKVAWVDKSHALPGMPPRFRHLLLRPPRFGKTAFLSLLEHYYDIHNVAIFSQTFHPLAVLPPDPADRHLYLTFHLSRLAIVLGQDDFVDFFNCYIDTTLECFLQKYTSELQISDPKEFVQSHKHDLLTSTLQKVADSPYSLFVSIDDYDAPSQRRFFAGVHDLEEDSFTQEAIELYLDLHFWKPLLDASEAIAKLFVTGTFPLQTPALENLRLLGLTVAPGLESSCGFTEAEALQLANSFVGETPHLPDLRRSCGEYIFSPADCQPAQPVLHPQRLLSRLSKLAGDGALLADAESFQRLPTILEGLPEHSDDPEAATIDGIIHLVASGAVDIGGPMQAPLHPTSECVPWGILYYLGAIVHDRTERHTLRLANSIVLSMIHDVVDQVIAVRHNLENRLSHAVQSWHTGENLKLLPELLSQVLQDQTNRSFDLHTEHEPDLRGIVELVMGNTCYTGNEMISPRLVGPTELFSTTGVSRVRASAKTSDLRHWELRTLTLRGLWYAANLNGGEPSVEILQEFHEKLMEEDDEALLARPYSSRSPGSEVIETVLVRSFVETKREDPLFLAVGGARVLTFVI
ncbi:hypothetical protein C8R46DRAFT_1346547 [Mycena filopes]|nr:hypothetical protein C8R46DRAFT_1346547 [Mycena filopes]